MVQHPSPEHPGFIDTGCAGAAAATGTGQPPDAPDSRRRRVKFKAQGSGADDRYRHLPNEILARIKIERERHACSHPIRVVVGVEIMIER